MQVKRPEDAGEQRWSFRPCLRAFRTRDCGGKSQIGAGYCGAERVLPRKKPLLRADVARSPARDDTGHAQAPDHQRSCDRSYCAGRWRGCGNTRCPLVPARRPSALCVCRYDVRTCRQRNYGLRKRLSRSEQLSDTSGFADFARALPNHMQSPWQPLHGEGLLPRAGGHRHLDALLGAHLNLCCCS